MKRWAILLAVSAVGCAGRLVPDSTDGAVVALPDVCHAPEFTPAECKPDVLNDGKGSDDHRVVCVRGNDQWIFYPSGEFFRLAIQPPDVLCRVLPTGEVAWPLADR
jgi:hypothetical protein